MATVEILNSSESAEWYTPARYVEAVRMTLCGIELDPASCEEANKTVKAQRIFTIEDDGLTKSWKANTVFCNPPYGKTGNQSNQGIWLRKMIAEYKAEHFCCGILLVNSCTGDPWFAPAWEFPICFTNHRIRFDGGGSKSPTKSNAFIYFGRDVERFKKEFAQIGNVR